MGEIVESNGEADFRCAVGAEGVVVTRCVAHGARVRVPARLGGGRVVALGDECFASAVSGGLAMKAVNGQLERVELPEGLVRIGRAAFRGCGRLEHLTLPESLAEIGDLAFSCTAVEELRLPRSCVRLSQLALRTGPESLLGPASPYRSKLDSIRVDEGNPLFAVKGNALCRRRDGGGLEAILCPGRADEVDLRGIAAIAPTAFAGTYEIGTLRFDEAVAFADGCGLALNASCETVEVTMGMGDETVPRGKCLISGAATERRGLSAMRHFPRGTVSSSASAVTFAFAMPSKGLQGRIFEATVGRDAFDLAAFLAAYDAALADEADRLLQSKLMLARLARPVCLEDDVRAAFEGVLKPVFDTLCVQFGARGYWRGFDDMADAGLLDAGNVSHAIDVLTARGDAPAVARLLEMKRARFGGGGFDYGL